MITGTIVDLGADGLGVMKHEGMVIFVPFTAVGDVVEVQLIKQKSNFAVGKLHAIIEASCDRIKPPCPYFGTCGGCQVQHLDAKAELKFKAKLIQDALRKIGGIQTALKVEVLTVEPRWYYRKHIQLQIRPRGKGFECGYIGVDNETILIVLECLLFLPREHSLFSNLKTFLNELENSFDDCGRLTVIKCHDERFIFEFYFEKSLPKNVGQVAEKAFQKNSSWKGALFSDHKTSFSIGDTFDVFDYAGLSIKITPRVFIQNHLQVSTQIYSDVCQALSGTTTILDLYCGIGVTSILLAKAATSVHGVESNAKSIELAKENAKMNGVLNATFQTAKVEDVIDGLLRTFKRDVVLLNPPRTGLDRHVVEALLKYPSQKIAYISCNPATLARDLKILIDGYRLDFCKGYDMFPHTSHVETLVILSKK